MEWFWYCIIAACLELGMILMREDQEPDFPQNILVVVGYDIAEDARENFADDVNMAAEESFCYCC